MDYFSHDERGFQSAFAQWRDDKLAPTAKILLRLGVSPLHVTILGVVLLLVASLLGPPQAWLVAILLTLYCACDGIDGPIARLNGSVHTGGSIVDMAADQAGVIFVTAAAVYHLGTNGPAGVVFSSAYISFIAFSVVANNLQIKYKFSLRVKYILYIIYCLGLFLLQDIVTPFLVIFAVYYVIFTIYLIALIYKFYDDKHRSARP